LKKRFTQSGHAFYIPLMPPLPSVVLTIAGFDPSSGAGVTADLKTIAAHGCYGISCITALTVQSTAGVRRVEPVSAATVRDSLAELASDMSIAAVRIGMLGDGAVLGAVSEFLDLPGLSNVVLDPILTSSSGAALLDQEGRKHLESLLPKVTVVTPNIDEAAALTGLPVTNLEQMRTAARRFHDMGVANVVITGGHLEKAVDLLSIAGPGEPEQIELVSDRLRSTSTHGTGCAFASAIACNLALGRQLRYAVVLAKAYVSKAIAHAYGLGKGIGPLNHLYRMEEQPQPRSVAEVPETK
jgi:hydroxymethylpyrimidine/phosphomethylpyrimidine kinase